MTENNRTEKESFVFYKSFRDSIKTLKTGKNKLLLYESIIELGLFGEVYPNNEQKSIDKFELFSNKIQQKLDTNKQVLGMFLLIKPQIFANYKKYFNGLKGKDYGQLGGKYGKLGGRPKNPPNVNDNVNDNVNGNEFI